MQLMQRPLTQEQAQSWGLGKEREAGWTWAGKSWLLRTEPLHIPRGRRNGGALPGEGMRGAMKRLRLQPSAERLPQRATRRMSRMEALLLQRCLGEMPCLTLQLTSMMRTVRMVARSTPRLLRPHPLNTDAKMKKLQKSCRSLQRELQTRGCRQRNWGTLGGRRQTRSRFDWT